MCWRGWPGSGSSPRLGATGQWLGGSSPSSRTARDAGGLRDARPAKLPWPRPETSHRARACPCRLEPGDASLPVARCGRPPCCPGQARSIHGAIDVRAGLAFLPHRQEGHRSASPVRGRPLPHRRGHIRTPAHTPSAGPDVHHSASVEQGRSGHDYAGFRKAVSLLHDKRRYCVFADLVRIAPKRPLTAHALSARSHTSFRP
jgi:hypothetical protein